MHPNPRPPDRYRRRPTLAVLGAVAALLAGYLAVATAHLASAADTLLSQGKPATASTTENAGTPASAAVDGNTGTRWSSAFSDPQWIQVDLGATATISQVVLNWEAAYGRAFQIQVSADANAWTTVYSTTSGTGGTQTLAVTGTGRYVRMYGTTRATGYGYSLWEFQVYGSTGSGGACGTANAALNRPATASSTENAGTPASAAVDGNTGTRWSSAASDPQWIQVDLGAAAGVCQVVLNWETAYGKTFQIQLSTDASAWTTVYSTTTGTGGVQTLAVSGTGRYVRMYGTTRATGYGYSLWEFEVRTSGSTGGPTATPTTTPTGTVPGGGSLGPNVLVFDPSMSASTVQRQLDTVFSRQESNQFGTDRYALLFKPGSYGVNANIGFYTSIAGLGRNPGDVVINGGVTVDAGWFNGNATQNFWRSAENLAINPTGGFNRWAVSQAAPFRRIDVRGDLNLAPNGYGWASGGYIADSRVSGTVQPYSQQQWYTRDSQIGGWLNGVWNMVFTGVTGAPATSFPNPPYTTVAQSPVTREKPYLYVDSAGAYNVFVPSLRTNSQGATWTGGGTPGSSIPLSQFYVAKPGDSAATLNAALAQGLNLLFTPGIYHVNQTVTVTRADTVVLGLGYATIIPDNGVVPMTVADVDGVRLAGLLFDAGPTNSPVLLRVGPDGSAGTGHAANPTSIQDVFFRIGGAGAGKATTSLVVNSSNAIIDHIWAWRADHGTGVGWTVNTADTGLIVNGANVTAYGLFVEHYQKYQVIWNGNGGRTYFFQNEMPYDPPNQAAWMNGGTNGYAAYKVASGVTSHEGWGLGSYCYFNVDPSVNAARGFEAPNTGGVRFHSLLTVSLGGNGTITNVINTTGGTAQGTSTVPVNVVSYP
ncbi:discoidin domain-containing protein [Rhizomonospora bruguierae]|uniref:discoidin domain-containing protein n=1 Tax=Rhizomonospora bruguierae TaxID=1581705 RepID=UPI001BCAC682|nr:discoidin domain-containing protein [Micromonospora sp. NBRC 107566]